jgi:hypothetical protein
MDDYFQAWQQWEESDSQYIRISLYDGQVAVATREEIEESEKLTLKEINKATLEFKN